MLTGGGQSHHIRTIGKSGSHTEEAKEINDTNLLLREACFHCSLFWGEGNASTRVDRWRHIGREKRDGWKKGDESAVTVLSSLSFA